MVKEKRDLWDAEHTCHNCNAKMKKKRLTIEGISVRGWECSECGETVLHTKDAEEALLANKLKAGVPAKIGVSGGSLFVRFPRQIVDYYELKVGETVKLAVKDKETLAVKLG